MRGVSLSTINNDREAPINPKIAPDAPRLITLKGNKNNENKFPINPEMKYINKNSNLEKLSST